MEEVKLSMYKYTMEDIDIIYSNGKKDKIPLLNIGSINIEKDFDNDFFPIFNINVSVPIEIRKKIVADKKVKARVRISKIAIKVTETHIDDKPKFVDPIIDGVFNIINSETDIDEKTKIQKESVNTGDGDAPTDYNTELSLFLYKQEWLDVNKDLDSMIFSDTDPMSAIVYLAKMNKVKRLLISKPDNFKKQTQIIVPETKFKTMLYNIENIYGVYSTGSVLFYDFEKLYYISKDIIKNLSRETGEITMVNINFDEFGSDFDRRPGSYLDKKNDRYFINSSNYPQFQNMSSYNKEALFNNINYVDCKTGETKSKSINLDGNPNDTKVLVDNPYNNPYIIESKLYDVKESTLIGVIGLQEIDVSHFTPNKRYMFSFNVKDFERSRKYNGNYRLSKAVHMFSKNGSDKWFEVKSACTFKRA